jgi:hypothetical protein
MSPTRFDVSNDGETMTVELDCPRCRQVATATYELKGLVWPGQEAEGDLEQ